MAENRTIQTQDELIEADAYFGIDSMMGRAIQAAEYQAMHPEYNPEHPVAEDRPGESVGPDGQYRINSNEESIQAQLEQIHALYSPEINKLLGSSALFSLLEYGAALYHLSSDDLRKQETPKIDQLDNMDTWFKTRKAAIWLLAKRVFAVRHYDETYKVLSLPEIIFNGSPAPSFRPIDETDKEIMKESCEYFFSDAQQEDISGGNPGRILPPVTPLPKTNKLWLPTSKAFQAILRLAKSGEKEKLPIDNRGTIVTMQIRGADTKKINGLSPLAKELFSTIGQMFYQFKMSPENKDKPLVVSTGTLYKRFSGKDDDYSPSETQLREIDKAMKELTETHISFDYSMQVEKHHLDRKKDFDPLNVSKRSAMVLADYTKASYKGNDLDAYTIYDVSSVYHNAFLIGQIATIKKDLLTGYMPKKQKAGIDDITLRRYLLLEIYRIQSDKKKKKITKPYTENLTFTTIASGSGFNASTPKLWRTLREKTEAYMREQIEAKNIIAYAPVFTQQKQTGISITV